MPDLGGSLDTLEPTLDGARRAAGVPYLIDPILEPIGFGFMASLERYAEVRRRYPDAEMLMGIGNLTELTAADSTGVNAMLIAVCQELGVRTVLTTEVIPWARGAVREIDVARRLMHYAVTGTDDPEGRGRSAGDGQGSGGAHLHRGGAARAAGGDHRSQLPHLRRPRRASRCSTHERFVRGTDIQEIFAQLDVDEPTHAFYLGKELARASLAVTLGKTYRQEGALSWGYLTPPDDAKSEHVQLTQRATRPRAAGRRRPNDR